MFAETWSTCKSCSNTKYIDNHHLLKAIDPIKIGKKGRKSGGIMIFIKNEFKNKIKIIKSNDNYAWIEVEKDVFQSFTRNILICAIYSQPASSNYFSEECWEDLENDLIYMTNNAVPFCIIGDMNGRVEEESEFLKLEKGTEEGPAEIGRIYQEKL